MKKIFLSLGILLCIAIQLKAGGLVTNSNQSAAYIRMLARGASTSGDAVYYNPAGLAFMDQGLTISLNSQMIWMKRTITNDLPTLNQNEFIGKLYVPVFPGVYATYKTGNWAFSLGFNPPAGGGSVKFADGLPMLETDVSLLPELLSAKGIPTTEYSMQSMMKGTSIVYGVQAGATYSITDMLGVFGGVRMSFARNGYEGYVSNIQINPTVPGINPQGAMISAPAFFTALSQLDPSVAPYASATSDQSLDLKQKGNGIAPILGLHFRVNSLNLAVKYEFRTKITLTNETTKNAMNMYPDGQELRSDVPALFSLGGSYDIVPAVKFSVTYLHHFEPQATLESWVPDATKPAGGYIVQRQDLIEHGTNEYMAGLEWKVTNKLVLSAGCQWSDVGVSNAWQNDITQNMDNFTLGLGAAYHFTDRLTLNVGGMYSWYDSPSVKGKIELPPYDYTQTYARTSQGIAVGIDYRF